MHICGFFAQANQGNFRFLCKGMGMFFTSLNSGSNGNCYYIGNQNEAVLIDAGISCREIEKRMKSLDLAMEKVKAVFVSHEHTDHIKGVAMLAKKHRLPVYITNTTLQHCFIKIDPPLVHSFCASLPVCIGGLTITAFSKKHDACDPFSFTIACEGLTVGVFTDIGTPCDQVVKYFKVCHAAFLESNYDDDMLNKGNYPYHLKRRIRGGMGHLSNIQALRIFREHRPPFMTHLVLSHLSQNNNCPKLVQELFNRHAAGVKMIVASRFEAMEVCYLEKTHAPRPRVAATQMSFSFA